MEFRKASIDDIDALVKLRKQQLLDEGTPELQNIDSQLEHYFRSGLSDDSFIAWLALENNAIIGTSGLCFYRLPPSYRNPSGMVAYVTNMFTVREYRRRGIASQLLAKILEEARLLNYSIVRLHASADGRNLYSKFGFTDSDGYMALKL